MKVLINTAHQRFGGAVQVASSFIHECRKFTGFSYEVWLGPGVGKTVRKEDFPEHFVFRNFDFGSVNFKAIRNIQRTLSKAEREAKPDIIISTSGPTYFHSMAPQIIGFNLPLYLYPESPYLKELSFITKLKVALKKKAHYYFFKRDASAFVVQTEDVNTRVRRFLNTDRVHTVSNTYNHYFDLQTRFPDRLGPRKSHELRLLTLSSYYPHKNLELIPQIADQLKKKGIDTIRFVLTLPESRFKYHIGKHPFIVNTGPVSPEECPALYNECDMMFLPTLAECFSASYPEAMKMAKPIITTNLGFARSICGDAAVYFEPKNPESAFRAVLELSRNTTLQNQLIMAGKKQLKKFDNAEERAEKYLKLCEKLSGLKRGEYV